MNHCNNFPHFHMQALQKESGLTQQISKDFPAMDVPTIISPSIRGFQQRPNHLTEENFAPSTRKNSKALLILKYAENT